VVPKKLTITSNNNHGVQSPSNRSACPTQRVCMMKQTTNEDRKKQVQQSLLEANVGCLLMFVLGCGLPFVAIGLFFVYQGLISLHEQVWLNTNVDSVPATVISSEVRTTTTKTGTGTGSTTTSYWANVEFTYEYEGQTRKSDRVWPVGEGGRETAMRSVVERYPPDTQVTAFVDRENPDAAFLEKRWSSMPYAFVGAGCLPAVFVAALSIVLAGWKRPDIATLCGLSIGLLVILGMLLAGEHYLRHVPASEQRWWAWLVLAATGAVALGILAAIGKARHLGQQYREAKKATSPIQGC
jgi:hypothetical protein